MAWNHITTIGNLVKDPEMKTVSGVSCVNFTLASDSINKDDAGKPIPNYYTCSAWRNAAETICKYCKKGDRIMVDGELVIRRYKSREGADMTAVTINVANFQFLNTKGTSGSGSGASRAPQKSADSDDELPF